MITFLIGNIICAIGTILQIITVVRNRDVLKGYGFIGSLLTFIAVGFFTYGFYQLDDILSVLFALVTLSFWLLVTLFSLRLRLKNET